LSEEDGMSRLSKEGLRAILADPVKRRELAVRFIMSAQAMEGIETTVAQAEAAYDRVQAERRGVLTKPTGCCRLSNERRKEDAHSRNRVKGAKRS
jgi:hypothetical protein